MFSFSTPATPTVLLLRLPLLLFLSFLNGAESASGTLIPDAVPGVWNWIPRNDMVCRNGSTTGIGFRQGKGAHALMIYLKGGGSCSDVESCSGNAANYPEANFRNWAASSAGKQGVFNIDNPSNMFAEWSHVYVPYCTGDLHGGLLENGSVPGVAGTQAFLGYQNFAKVLELVAPHFQDAIDIALVGSSAGAIGVLINYPATVAVFGGRSVVALVDSAPILPPVLGIKTSCLMSRIISTFNLQLPPDCSACANPDEGGLVNLYSYHATTYPTGRLAVASADADAFGVAMYNAESPACGGVGVDGTNHRLAVYHLRDTLAVEWATFYPTATQHTMINNDGLFFQRTFQGTSAAQWLNRINEQPPIHIPAAFTQPEPPRSNACFSGFNKVEVQGKGFIAFDRLQIGDYVRAGHNRFSRVYGFHHLDRKIKVEYLQIFVNDKKEPLEITSDHLVFVGSSENALVPASQLKIGDVLGDDTIRAIQTVKRRGAYAPLTYSGSLVVSGILTSAYVHTLDQFPPALEHTAAHAILALRRVVCYWNFDTCRNETYTDGLPDWCFLALRLLEMLRQHLISVQVVVCLLVSALLIAFLSPRVIVRSLYKIPKTVKTV